MILFSRTVAKRFAAEIVCPIYRLLRRNYKALFFTYLIFCKVFECYCHQSSVIDYVQVNIRMCHFQFFCRGFCRFKIFLPCFRTQNPLLKFVGKDQTIYWPILISTTQLLLVDVYRNIHNFVLKSLGKHFAQNFHIPFHILCVVWYIPAANTIESYSLALEYREACEGVVTLSRVWLMMESFFKMLQNNFSCIYIVQK